MFGVGSRSSSWPAAALAGGGGTFVGAVAGLGPISLVVGGALTVGLVLQGWRRRGFGLVLLGWRRRGFELTTALGFRSVPARH